jgi:hypothetical protein
MSTVKTSQYVLPTCMRLPVMAMGSAVRLDEPGVHWVAVDGIQVLLTPVAMSLETLSSDGPAKAWKQGGHLKRHQAGGGES